MKKKGIVFGGILAIILVVLLGAMIFKPKEVQGDKEITVIVMEQDSILFDETISTDATILGALLDEVESLEMVTEDSSFGRFITSLVGKEQGDISTGPWWLYSSENNEVCLQMGYCPGIDEVSIQDGDIFTFELTNDY